MLCIGKENLKVISESLEGNLEQLRSELNALKPDKIGKIEPDIKKSENFIARINQLHVQIDAVKQDLNEQVSISSILIIATSMIFLKNMLFIGLALKYKKNRCLTGE